MLRVSSPGVVGELGVKRQGSAWTRGGDGATRRNRVRGGGVADVREEEPAGWHLVSHREAGSHSEWQERSPRRVWVEKLFGLMCLPVAAVGGGI